MQASRHITTLTLALFVAACAEQHGQTGTEAPREPTAQAQSQAISEPARARHDADKNIPRPVDPRRKIIPPARLRKSFT